ATPRAWSAPSASALPTGPPRLARGAPGTYEKKLRVRNTARAAADIAAASRSTLVLALAGLRRAAIIRPYPACSPARRTSRPPPESPPHPSPRPDLLHLNHEGEDHGAPLETLEIATQCAPDLLLDLRRIGARLGVDGGQSFEDGRARGLEDLRARLFRHHPARHQIRTRNDLARLLMNRQPRQDQ